MSVGKKLVRLACRSDVDKPASAACSRRLARRLAWAWMLSTRARPSGRGSDSVVSDMAWTSGVVVISVARFGANGALGPIQGSDGTGSAGPFAAGPSGAATSGGVGQSFHHG